MRRSIILGLLALSLGFSANSAFAGNAEECEILKDGYTKGLYGLCIAWHNAGSDNARDRILANYNNKAKLGDPELPGTDNADTCPCTVDQDLSTWGIVVYCISDAFGGDQGLFVDTGTNFTTEFTTLAEDGFYSCSLLQSPATFIDRQITAGEYAICLSQLESQCY